MNAFERLDTRALDDFESSMPPQRPMTAPPRTLASFLGDWAQDMAYTSLGGPQLFNYFQRQEQLKAQQQAMQQEWLANGFQTIQKISAIEDPGLRNSLLENFAGQWRSPTGQPMIGPESLTAFKKTGDKTRALMMSLIEKYGAQTFGTMSPEQLGEIFQSPLSLFEMVDKMQGLDKRERERQAEEARRQAYGSLEQQGIPQDLDTAISNVGRAIVAGEAQGANMDGAYSLLNSLAQQKSQLEQSRHHAATEQISQQGLAMQRQEMAKPQAAGGNLDELTSQLTGGEYTGYFAAPVKPRLRGLSWRDKRERPRKSRGPCPHSRAKSSG